MAFKLTDYTEERPRGNTMNINELREELGLNKKNVEGVRVYLSKGGTDKEQTKQYYSGYIVIGGFPLHSIKAEKALKERAWTNKDGTPVIDEFTNEQKISKTGDTVIELTTNIGDVEEDFKAYGEIIELKKKDGSGNLTSAKFKSFEIKLFGEILLKFDLKGIANDKGSIPLGFDSYRMESYESDEAVIERNNGKHKPAVLKSVYEPMKQGWTWEDLAELAKSLMTEDDVKKFKEFMKENFPSSNYEKRQIEVTPAAQAILDKVQARKSGVSQLNAKQKASATQGQIDFEAGF